MTRAATTSPAPPYSAEAEAAVLGAVLNHPWTARDVLAVVAPESFYVTRYAAAMRIVAELSGEGVPAEPQTVHGRLGGEGMDLAELDSLRAEAPSDGGALECARVVTRRAAERAALAEAGELRHAAETGRLEESLPAILDRLGALGLPGADPVADRGRIDWSTFWAADHSATDWLIEPFLVRGRAHSLYAPGKAGKSLFVLAVTAAGGTGRPVLRQPGGEPVRVTYLDYEMTQDDVQERLSAMGYDETSDLSNLRYYLLPSLPPLDTPEGGRALAGIIDDDRPELVVIDTTARAVTGEENSADTIRNFYRYSGIVLKRAGVTSLRVDHSGKDLTKGQRGTSAKNDDVDVVWQLTRADSGVTLRATHRRLGWVPETVDYRQVDEPVLHYVPAPALWPAGTADVAQLLDRHGVAVDASVRTAKTALRQAGIGKRQDLVRAALKWRRAQLEEQQQWAS